MISILDLKLNRVTILVLFCLAVFNNKTLAQTQKNSIRTGVTFQWADTQSIPQDPATITSITIDSTIYASFTIPSSYVLTRLGPEGHGLNRIRENGVLVNTSSANPDWNADAISAFQDKNLNHYFTSDRNGQNICNDFEAVAMDSISATDTQIQSLIYNPPIPSNDGGLIAVTERSANNCFYISVYGIRSGGTTEEYLGDTFVRPNNNTQNGAQLNPPPSGVDYWNSGRVNENNTTIGIALFTLNDLAPTGSRITRVDLTAATKDHGDGKFFIMQKYAVPVDERACVNETLNGTVDSNSTPDGSTFSLLSGPSPPGQSFTFNPDGSYTYVPTLNYIGEVAFNFEVCLPSPNDSICDSDTATITYETGPGTGCECDSGNADAPSLQN